ncbi:MAG: roadblock/LC7 domain-containing protein [Proteobacteria bacterium]|nr:roadblock/LC7 domain-containing protein [Pseudomonadota bacterium]
MASVFSEILDELLRELPEALGAIFIDWEGESVDHSAGDLGATNIRLVGAHWGIAYNLMRRACEQLELGTPTNLVLRFAERRVVIGRVVEGYYLVIATAANSPLWRTLRALRQTRERLLKEL